MTERATIIIKGMQEMAKGQSHHSPETSVIRWMGFRCCYYPGSQRFAWFKGSKDITRNLDRRTLVSLINNELVS
jgi:hypothetical protein